MAATADEPGPWTRAESVSAMVSLLLGVAPIVLIVIEWCVAWQILGHRPRPMLDDPKSIGGVIPVFHSVTGLSLLAPVWMIPWSSLRWLARRGESRTGQLVALGCFLLPLATVVILFAGDFEPVAWWLD